jgi:hypothetical protein
LIPYLVIVLTSAQPAADTCSGAAALLFNGAFNAMLLALFINFHIQTYRRRKSVKAE